jgi:hypothetical protein
LTACNHISYKYAFNRASKAHTGSYLTAHISECPHKYGIQGKYVFYLIFPNVPHSLTVVVEEDENNSEPDVEINHDKSL